MGKFTWHGWQKSAEGAAEPTGAGTTRDGYLIISLSPNHLELARKLAEYHREQTAEPDAAPKRPPRKR